MPQQATADQSLVRRLNTAIVLEMLRRDAPLSRAELSARTGLNRSTVSSIVNSLIQDGFVQETDLQSSRIGRPGMLLVLNPAGGFAIGIELGVDFISAMVTDFVAGILWQKRIVIDPDEDQMHIVDLALILTQEALAYGRAQGLRPLGIGVVVPGLVDIHQGMLVFAPNLHWSDVPLRSLWMQRFSLPVFVENEANAAALGEYYFGVARYVENFIYLNTGVGLGGGVIIGGKLFRGYSGYASEVGHMRLEPDGELCGCGQRGCWETLVGPRAVVQRVRNILQAGAVSVLNDLSGDDANQVNFSMVVEGARCGDRIALSALTEVGRYLGLGIANLVNIFNPQLVVLGGLLNLADSMLLPVVQQTVYQHALPPACQGVQVVASKNGVDAAVIGAIALVLDDIFREPSFG